MKSKKLVTLSVALQIGLILAGTAAWAEGQTGQLSSTDCAGVSSNAGSGAPTATGAAPAPAASPAPGKSAISGQ